MSHKNYYLSKYEQDNLRDHFIMKILFAIAIILILTIGAICIIRVDYVMKTQIDIEIMQTDTLNQVMDLRQEVESIKTDAENRSQVNSVALTPKERALIERIVMSESSIEGLEAQMAVAQTIYDRMNDWGYSFEMAVNTDIYSRRDNGAPTDSVKLAVSNVFEKDIRIYEGGTYQFHDDTVSPYWIENKVKRGSIGRLTFYGGYVE